ncbi:hypothetical protein CLV24_115139 [Pontibacter ummariensis]|uniref:Uncharacterized protein n=1 Tax=Pontibacter ummariensis TaxID=1610492 RepID=A0A239I4D6_9BACT|nr:hypothetical protein [Pontibacter ummariensis]PRY10222.1 hypothetical protein CLV24_115139 [Pontibacter ummariensis]SNS88389.1 hypothetical protein SAMN06296052_115139 [Pontibacter ummariensis]
MIEYSMFQRLPLRSQAEVLAKDGTILAQRQHKEWVVTLYALGDSFVELWSGKEAEVIGAFKKSASTLAIFEPYVDEINVQDYLDNGL